MSQVKNKGTDVKSKSSKGFFKGFITSILLIVIIGGSAYVADSMFGYNILGEFLSKTTTNTAGAMNMGSSSTQSNTSTQNSNMNMSNSTTNNQTNTVQNNYSLQNGDSLDKILGLVNDSLKTMTLDPYGTDTSSNMNNMNGQQNTVQSPTNGTQGSAVVNIYPSNNGNSSQTSTMGNMGTTYDASKMDQLHTGLYKVSIGIQLLNQLKDDISAQAGQVFYDPNNLYQYYTTEYNFAVQNKSSLSKAADYINAAGDLMNVNPYTSSNGLVYDKDRMAQIHKSIFTMAEAVVELSKLSTNLTNQTYVFSNLAQNSYNNANSNMNMNMNTNNSLFSNISTQTIGNIILILFVSAFIIGILGFIFSLTKPKKNLVKPEIEAEKSV
jgi:hypothetical protein